MYVLPTERQILPNNTTITLNGTEYKILDTKGRGASCVVYLAENCTNKRIVLIKELYPINLGIFRDKENNLIVPNSFCEHFKFYKHKLCEAYKLQLEFHNSDETGNYTSDAETMVEAYSTLYVIMNKVVGSSYDKVVPENITDVLEVCKSVATVIGFYHKKGYLHLDIKPDNIYVLKETNQIINLFDFDTVKSKSDLENGNYIASTNKISAPEISKAEIDEFTGKYLQEVDERADIYAIGHILFEKVMERDAKSSDIILGKKFNLGKTKLLKNSSPQLREKIQEIFQHTVVRMKSERYSNTDEFIKALDQALEIATEEKDGYLIDNNITITTSNSYYISRKDKLSEIRQHLENYHIEYLYGIGGIGKSETAREYAEEYRGSYTTIQLSIYSGDLKSLIAGLEFSNDNKTGGYFEKDINIRYETKLSLLSKAMINNERTLLIIDNYNVEPDSDECKRNVEVMKDLKKLHIHILFTTRTLPNDDKTKIDVEEFSKEELRHMFFAINSKDKDKEERIAQVDELIETAYRHTLTVDLVAHQTAKIEGYGKKTLSDYIKVLEESGINSGINVAVYNNKDDNEKSDVIFEHIRALFNLTALTEKEKYIMVNACLLPLSGMPVAEFESFIDLENYPNSESNDGWGEDSTISNLVKSGWMKRINGEVSKITLHPIISQLIEFEMLYGKGVLIYCYTVIQNLTKIYDWPQKVDYAPLDFYLFINNTWICALKQLVKYSKQTELELIYNLILEFLILMNRWGMGAFCGLELENRLNAILKFLIDKSKENLMKAKFIELDLLFCKMIHKVNIDFVTEQQKILINLLEKVKKENFVWSSLLNLYVLFPTEFYQINAVNRSFNSIQKSLKINQLINNQISPILLTDFFTQSFLLSSILSQSNKSTEKNMMITYICEERKKYLTHFFKCFTFFWKNFLYNWPTYYIAEYYNDLAQCCGYLKKFDLQMKYYLKAVYFSELKGFYNKKSYKVKSKISEQNLDSEQLFKISKAYSFYGNIEKALLYSLQNEKKFEAKEESNEKYFAILLGNICWYYMELDNYTMSLKYGFRSLKIYEKNYQESYFSIADICNYIGFCYWKLDDFNQALKYYFKALEIEERIFSKKHHEVAISLNNIGYAYKGLLEYEKALEYMLKAFFIFEREETKDYNQLSNLSFNISLIYGEIGDRKNKDKYYKKYQEYINSIRSKN